MRKKLVAGNWKMHGNLQKNAVLLDGLVNNISVLSCEVLICPPFPYLVQVAESLGGSSCMLGAQNLSEYAMGAYTGEVSGEMLKDVGCSHVLVGHSERRSLYGESDTIVAAKFESAQLAGLCPILCVGETLTEREAGATANVVARQLGAVIDRVGVQALQNAVLAYEPVWAIGTGVTATPEQAQLVHAAIRAQVSALAPDVGASVRILYGGSVKPQNAADLFGRPDIDGGLIGGAALVAGDFLAICRAAV